MRIIDRVAPALGTHSALRLFVTPFPWKLAARAAVPSRWAIDAWPFEDGSLAVYRRRGIDADKPPVLLVHGWAGSGAQMFRLGDALADAGFNPVLVDFTGTAGAADGARCCRSSRAQSTRRLRGWALC